jgi:hypothetical protein
MPSIRELSVWIREYGQDPRHQRRLIADQFLWHQTWAAMDIIDDVDSAFDAYIDNDFPTDIAERYLRIYGVMQALFLQQDALSDLIQAIHPTRPIVPNDVLKDIREARNISVGHPTRLKRKGSLSTHGIVQNSMRKDGFDLLSYPSQAGKIFQAIPVLALIAQQRAETTRILSEVVEDLREQERVHRAKFKDSKLVDALRLANYAFEKIFEGLRPGRYPTLGSWAVRQLQLSLNDFSDLLKQRGLEVGSYDSIKYRYDEISHPLAELTKFMSQESSEVASAESAAVFATALQTHFDQLREIARELDDEYVSEPTPVVRPQASDETPINVTISVIGQEPELS